MRAEYVKVIRKSPLLLPLLFSLNVSATAVEVAVTSAKIKRSDSLEAKIDKALWLLNEQRFFYPTGSPPKLDPPFDIPYHLDSLRSPEEILSQKVGGSCGSSARAFAAMLISAGVEERDIQVVESVVNRDLKIICPRAKYPRLDNPRAGAKGHSFVAIHFPGGKWKIINPIDGSQRYGRADWYDPQDLQRRLNQGPVAIPAAAFERLPRETYGDGLTAFQSWILKDAPVHTFAQRFDLIASGRIGGPEDQSVKICRFTSPK